MPAKPIRFQPIVAVAGMKAEKEHWFQIGMTAGQVLDVVQTAASVDIDYFITDAAGGSTCYDGAYGNTGATAAIGSSGNYYISCDGYRRCFRNFYNFC